ERTTPRHPLVELLGPPGAPAIGGAAAGHRRARATQGTPTPGAAGRGFREGGEIGEGREEVVGAVVDHTLTKEDAEQLTQGAARVFGGQYQQLAVLRSRGVHK